MQSTNLKPPLQNGKIQIPEGGEEHSIKGWINTNYEDRANEEAKLAVAEVIRLIEKHDLSIRLKITKKIADVQPSDWPQIAYFNMYRNKYRMEGLQPVSQTTREPQFQPSAPAAADDPFTVK
tara:strand:- start:170 stop:535 length:366 start_codon:yes stop_codon:yes gene_type:complete